VGSDDSDPASSCASPTDPAIVISLAAARAARRVTVGVRERGRQDRGGGVTRQEGAQAARQAGDARDEGRAQEEGESGRSGGPRSAGAPEEAAEEKVAPLVSA